MKQRTADAIHNATNMAYWIENPDWHTGIRVADVALVGVRKLNLDMYRRLSERFFDVDKLIAVNGESVVVKSGEDEVDKFMFRRPRRMALETFEGHVTDEIGTMTRYLTDVAMPTTVAIKPARIFRNPRTQIDAVAQTQTRLDLALHAEMKPELLEAMESGPAADKTARDLELLVMGAGRMLEECGLYPDIADNGGNLRRHSMDGSVTLIDMMPFYEDGSRLIGTSPPGVIPHVQRNMAAYEEFVGQYGA